MLHFLLFYLLEGPRVLTISSLPLLSFTGGALVFGVYITFYHSTLAKQIRLVRGGYSDVAIDKVKKIMSGFGFVLTVFMLGLIPTIAILLALAGMKLIWTYWTALALVIEDTKIPNAVRRLLGLKERPNWLRTTTGG